MTLRVFLSRVRDGFLALLVLLILVSNFSYRASASSTMGPYNAGTGTDVLDGQNSWSNPANITSVGSPYATINLAHGKNSHYLQGTDYGFSIPADAVILGISVDIMRAGEQNGIYGIQDGHIYLVKNGKMSGDNKAVISANWPTSMEQKSYGSAGDLWGLTWTAADVNDVNFGVALSAFNSDLTASLLGSVDYMQISVTYADDHTPTNATVSSSVNPSTYSQAVTFTAVVTPSEATGTVQIKIDGADFGTPVALASGSVTSPPISSLSAGNHTVIAVYSGDSNYGESSGSLPGGQTVTRASATVTLGNLNQVYDGSEKTVTAVTVPPGLEVTFTYDGSSTPPTNTGNYAVVGTVNDANYGGDATDNLIITKANQSITFGPLVNKTYGDANFTLSGSVTSGLPLGYSVVSGPATVTGNTVTLNGAGSVTVQASQGGNSNYNAALDVTQSFTIFKAQPLFTNLAGPGISKGSTPTILGGTLKAGSLVPTGSVSITLNGVSQNAPIDSSGIFSSSFNTGGLTVSGSPFPISYTYAGNTNFKAAQDNSQVLKVTAGTASVTLGSLYQVYDGEPKTVTASTVPQGLNVSITYNGSGTAPVNAGNYAVVATVNDPNYSGQSTGTLVIAKAVPAFSNLSGPSISAGTTSTDLGGILKAGSLIPTGIISITLNGVSQNAAIDSSGNFSSGFAAGSLTVSGSPYPINYSYEGSANFETARDNSRTLTVMSSSGGGGSGGSPSGGGSGGAAPIVNTVVITGFKSGARLDMDSNGKVRSDVELKSGDERVILNIHQNTELRDSKNKILSSLSAARVDSPPGKSDGTEIAMAYDFGPEGAVFQPSITLTLVYDPASLPENVSEESLVIAWWDGSAWVDQVSELNIVNHTVSSLVGHFSLYALAGKFMLPSPSAAPSRVQETPSTPTPSAVEVPDTTPGEPATPGVILPSDAGPSSAPPEVPSITATGETDKPVVQAAEQPWSILLLIYLSSFTATIAATILVVLKLRQKRTR